MRDLRASVKDVKADNSVCHSLDRSFSLAFRMEDDMSLPVAVRNPIAVALQRRTGLCAKEAYVSGGSGNIGSR